MRTITTFSDAERELNQFVPTGPQTTNYTLDTIKQLMSFIGNPQDQLRVIHVAGTSGKTSTAYYIAGLLNAVGYTTGLTVSPHITHINERTQIDMQPLPQDEYCHDMAEFLELVDTSGLQPSHFELLVAFSYWVFASHKVDIAVVEVGLGGLLDGTNVVSRADKVCVITDIGFDHEQILGDTLAKIAAQKAGIIQPKNDVFMYEQSAEVMDVVRQTVETKQAHLRVVAPTTIGHIEDIPSFQQRNFTLASSVVTFVLERDGHVQATDEQILSAAHTHIPGRMEIIRYKDKLLILDGAHNKQKISALVSAVKQQFPNADMTLLVSFGQNKQASVDASLKSLRQLGSSIIITKFNKGQDEARSGMEPSDLLIRAEHAGFTAITVEEDVPAALELLVKAKSDVGLVVGSLYLIETVLPLVA